MGSKPGHIHVCLVGRTHLGGVFVKRRRRCSVHAGSVFPNPGWGEEIRPSYRHITCLDRIVSGVTKCTDSSDARHPPWISREGSERRPKTSHFLWNQELKRIKWKFQSFGIGEEETSESNRKLSFPRVGSEAVAAAEACEKWLKQPGLELFQQSTTSICNTIRVNLTTRHISYFTHITHMWLL